MGDAIVLTPRLPIGGLRSPSRRSVSTPSTWKKPFAVIRNSTSPTTRIGRRKDIESLPNSSSRACGARSSRGLLAVHEDGAGRVPHHVFRGAAEHHLDDPAVAVGSDEQEIVAGALDHLDDAR